MQVVKRSFRGYGALALGLSTLLSAAGCSWPAPNVRLFEWERGIGVESLEQPGMSMYLWFYEWNMFEAVQSGQHTHADFAQFTHHVDAAGRRAEIRGANMTLKFTAVRDGADMRLRVTNRSDHDWPDLAGIIPCFNPGPTASRNPAFANENTWFVGPDGLARQDKREIHFNADLRSRVDACSGQGSFAWSRKWPTSPVNSTAGLLLRESTDGQWATGIAWERFLSAQGHNPWKCMHLCVLVGPLKKGQTRTVHGRIYLFKGTRDDCLQRYRGEFGRKEGR
jgi:hypothetical protein